MTNMVTSSLSGNPALDPARELPVSLPAPETPPALQTIDFQLPPNLEADQPPEARGLARDEVRVMVSYRSSGEIVHTRFRRIIDFLCPGDVLVINTSGTLPAALPAWLADGTPLELHLSTHLPSGEWTVELRRLEGEKNLPFEAAHPWMALSLPEGAEAVLLAPYTRPAVQEGPAGKINRLWVANLLLPLPFENYLARHGFPIRYPYIKGNWPLSYYMTAYANEPGSAEMPSAGRAFTPLLITRLVASGIQLAPLILHTGVASLERDEPPYPEYFRVPQTSAELVNMALSEGRRVIAVGTTSVRALESATDESGHVHPTEGWTDLVITPERGLRAVSGLLTGLHEPRSSHLSMLAALAGFDHIRRAYAEALEKSYLWHEFGDLHLIFP